MSTATLMLPSASLEGPLDEPLYEIVDGVEVELPSTSAESSFIGGRLYGDMAHVVEENQLGTACIESLFIIDRVKDRRRRPDVAFISAERWPIDRNPPSVGDWDLVPDLAVEVVSPNDVMNEVLATLREYFRYGVQEVWIVVPAETNAMIYTSVKDVRIVDADGALETPLIPGWKLPLTTLFRLTPAPWP